MFALRQVARCSKLIKNNATQKVNTTTVRHGGSWSYRNSSPAAPDSFGNKFAYTGFFLVWYWILYNLIAHTDHVTGHFPYPKPKTWTDEELGIPPDNED